MKFQSIIVLLFILVNPACSFNVANKWYNAVTFRNTCDNHTDINIEKQKYSSNSFFVFVERYENGTLSLDKGMSVVVFSDENQSVLLTCNHLVENATKIRVRPWSGEPSLAMDGSYIRFKTIPADIIHMSPEDDAALLKIELGNINVAKPILRDVEVGSSIVVLGFPFFGAMSRGIVSAYWPIKNQGILMVSDAVTTAGYSGGGAFLENNDYLIGLVTGKTADQTRGFAYIVPISRLLPLLNKIPMLIDSYNCKRIFGFSISERQIEENLFNSLSLLNINILQFIDNYRSNKKSIVDIK